MIERRHAAPTKPVIIEHLGKIYQGSFYVERGLITVSYGAQKNVTQMGEMLPITCAKMILREIVGGKSERR